jgi:hypothetical protein
VWSASSSLAYFRVVYTVTHKAPKTGNGNCRRKEIKKDEKNHTEGKKYMKENRCPESAGVISKLHAPLRDDYRFSFMLFGRSNVTQVDTLNDADIGH